MSPVFETSDVCTCTDGHRVLLPFLRQSPIAAYNYSAFLLGSTIASNTSHVNFLYNNYIQLSSPAIYNDNHLIAYIPALGVDDAGAVKLGDVEKHGYNNGAEIKRIIVEGINRGFYARVVLDEYYIDGTYAFYKKHHIHDNLIVGYCQKCERVFMVGYRKGKSSYLGIESVPTFGLTICTLESVCEAILSRPGDSKPKFLQDQILLFRPSKTSMVIDPVAIRYLLKCYLNSTHDERFLISRGFPCTTVSCPSQKMTTMSYGLSAKQKSLSYIRCTCDSGGPVDARVIRMVWEHSLQMKNRLILAMEYSSTKPPQIFNQLIHQMDKAGIAIRLQLMSYLMTPTKTLGYQLIASLTRLHELESELIYHSLK